MGSQEKRGGEGELGEAAWIRERLRELEGARGKLWLPTFSGFIISRALGGCLWK